MSTHQAFAISITPTGGSASIIHAIDRQAVSSASDVNSEVDAGSPYPQSVTINGQKNEATASTRDIRNALGILGTEGVGGLIKFWQLALDNTTGLHASGSVHRALTINRAKIIPVRLTCEHQRDAVLDIQAFAIYDGSNVPIVPSGTEAMPTGLAGDERFTLHEASVGGIALDCNLRVEIDFGIEVATEGCNSDIWDDAVVIGTIRPRITISGKNIAKFAATGAIPLVGAAGTHANTEITLRKRSQNLAGFVADATAEHIQFTADCLAHWETVHEAGSGNGRVENRLVLECRHDGTNVPLVVDEDYALAAPP